jgi:biopolymer transport protein ExbD
MGTGEWLKTRTFEPVNVPISLEVGQIETRAFEINLREDYWVYVDVDYSMDDYYPDRCTSRNLEGSHWRMYRIGEGKATKRELWATADELRKQGLSGDAFRAETGNYQLEWDAPAGASCLNARHPRLRVRTSSIAYEENYESILYACLLIGGVGGSLMLAALIASLRGVLAGREALRIFPGMTLRNVIPLQWHRPLPLIRNLPNFGLIYGFILWILVFIFMIVRPSTPKGLLVDFRERNSVGVEKSPWTETMSVYAEARRGFLVNGQPVKREELRAKLQEELLRRGVWVVYFEADIDCAFMDAAYAFDTIQGLGAKVIWITPKTREVWKQQEAP